jgi:tetratricopeptide (TPR) repeat protein
VRSDQVIEQVLGTTPQALDGVFRQHTKQALARYDTQFVPRLRPELPDEVKLAYERAPEDPAVQLRVARTAFEAGSVEEAKGLVAKVLGKQPAVPDALYLSGQIALDTRDAAGAERDAKRLLTLGHDGYWTEMLLAEATLGQKRAADARASLEAAHRFDPQQAEPLVALAKIAHAEDNAAKELEALRALGKLEQHSGGVFERLFELLVAQGQFRDVVALGETALWADLSNFEVHFLLGRALRETGDLKRATFEYESAALCEAPPPKKLEALEALAELYRRTGKTKAARDLQSRIKELSSEPPQPKPDAAAEPAP